MGAAGAQEELIAEGAEVPRIAEKGKSRFYPCFRTVAIRVASKAFRARVTFARISVAWAVQIKGFGDSLCFSM